MTLSLLRRYRNARMLVYDNRSNAEAFVRRHVAPKYWRRIDVKELDLARLSARPLDEGIKRHWGASHRFALVTHITDRHPCMTLSDMYHRQSPHRHKDSSPKSSKAKRDDNMFRHMLRLIGKVLSAAPHAVVAIEGQGFSTTARRAACPGEAGVAAHGGLPLLERR